MSTLVMRRFFLAALLLLAGCDAAVPPVADEDSGHDETSAGKTLPSSYLPTDELLVPDRWEEVPELPKPVAVLEHVFWQPQDTVSLRAMIAQSELVKGRSVLEIGTGSGLVALCCLQAGARGVVATDVNPWAIKNVVLNAERMDFTDQLSARLVPLRSPEAWTVIGDSEKFDVIVSNPPWEDGNPVHIEEFGDFDPGYRLLDSIVEAAEKHLNPGGRILLAYGNVTAIRRLQHKSAEHGYRFKVLDSRDPDRLPEDFLPGMLVEISIPENESAD